jgi:hypothetical protein
VSGVEHDVLGVEKERPLPPRGTGDAVANGGVEEGEGDRVGAVEEGAGSLGLCRIRDDGPAEQDAVVHVAARDTQIDLHRGDERGAGREPRNDRGPGIDPFERRLCRSTIASSKSCDVHPIDAVARDRRMLVVRTSVVERLRDPNPGSET